MNDKRCFVQSPHHDDDRRLGRDCTGGTGANATAWTTSGTAAAASSPSVHSSPALRGGPESECREGPGAGISPLSASSSCPREHPSNGVGGWRWGSSLRARSRHPGPVRPAVEGDACRVVSDVNSLALGMATLRVIGSRGIDKTPEAGPTVVQRTRRCGPNGWPRLSAKARPGSGDDPGASR